MYVARKPDGRVELYKAQLAFEGMRAWEELVHGQIHVCEGLLDVRSQAVCDAAAIGEEDADVLAVVGSHSRLRCYSVILAELVLARYDRPLEVALAMASQWCVVTVGAKVRKGKSLR